MTKTKHQIEKDKANAEKNAHRDMELRAFEQALVCGTDWVGLPVKGHHGAGKPIDIERDKHSQKGGGVVWAHFQVKPSFFSSCVLPRLHDANSLARINEIMATESAMTPLNSSVPLPFPIT